MRSGQKVRDYRLEEKIGEGGMGEVWCARHTVLHRQVAIKVMARHLEADPGFGQRFLHEAQAQGRLSHPRIVGVSDFFEEAGQYFLVMPLMSGKTLADRLHEAQGALPVSEALTVARDVLDALDYAHQQGVIHRDVKPLNIVLDQGGHACLTDFGIALSLGGRRFTQTGASLGTPHYMSPEQIRTPRSVDHRTDVYSFACVLYEMLAGRPPFVAAAEADDTDFALKEAHVYHVPEPTRTWNSQVPAWLDAVVQRALAKKPDERFSGCGEFRRALDAPSPLEPQHVVKEAVPANASEKHPLAALIATSLAALTIIVLIATRGGCRPEEAEVEESTTVMIEEPMGTDMAVDLPSGVERGGSLVPPPQVEVPCVPGETITENGIVFVRICPGSFIMGSAVNDPQAFAEEKPAHRVTLSEFWIGKTEFTNEQYRRFRPDHQGEAGLPATNLSWAEAKAACEFFGGRLPTEAEWEYAARAGSQTSWSFGDDVERLGEYAWYGEEIGSAPHPVGMKKPNGWGLHDVYGNVWEWVGDWYAPYPALVPSNPTGPPQGENRVMRGGCFANPPKEARSAVRGRNSPEMLFRGYGFRCALSPGS